MAVKIRKTKNPNQTKYIPPSNPDVAAKKFGLLLFIIIGSVTGLFSIVYFIPKTPNYSVIFFSRASNLVFKKETKNWNKNFF